MKKMPGRDPGKQWEVVDPEVERLLGALAHDLESEGSEDDFLRSLESRIREEKQRPVRPVEAPPPKAPTLRWLPMAAAVLCLAALSGAFLLWWNTPEFGSIEFAQALVEEPAAELAAGAAVQTLPDGGASIILDEGRIRLLLAEETAVVLAARDRVELGAGSLWVEVVPDSGPFAISTPLGDVHVTGTQFGIVLTNEMLRVELLRGGLLVESATQSLALAPGQSATRARGGDFTHDLDAPVAVPDWAKVILSRLARAGARSYFPSVVPDKEGQVRFEQ